LGFALSVVNHAFAVVGPVLFVAISVIAVRLLGYWRSFLFRWDRYVGVRWLRPAICGRWTCRT
jgi:hypothetical protein